MVPIREPQEALYHIMEAALFTYRFDPARRTVILVTDYPFKSPDSVREFAAFVFEGADFERLPGDYPSYQQWQQVFQASGPGAFVIESIEQRTLDSGRHWIEVWFGSNLGGIAITYITVRGYTRGSKATQVAPMDWDYRDSKTDEPFDFDYPFPSLAGPLP